MITAALIALAALIVNAFASVLPDLPDPDDSIGNAGSAWGQLVGYMAGATGWLPFGLAVTCIAVIALLAGAAGVIRLVRIVASFLSGGGGSAA